MKKGPSMPGKYSPRTDMCGTVGTAKKQHTAVAAFMAHRNPPRLPNGEINQSYVVPLACGQRCTISSDITQWRKVIHAKNINQPYNDIMLML
jgi:hypothetical protein